MEFYFILSVGTMYKQHSKKYTIKHKTHESGFTLFMIFPKELIKNECMWGIYIHIFFILSTHPCAISVFES